VSRELARTLAPEKATGPLIAQADPRPRPHHAVVSPNNPPPQNPPPSTPPGNTTQVIQIDPSSYVQNTNSNAIYWQQENNRAPGNIGNAAPPDAGVPLDAAPEIATADSAALTPVVRPPIQRPANPVLRAEPPSPVTITVSPLEWRTLPFAGAPALVAVRQVQTPDGNLVQGFVVDRATVTGMLASRAGDMVAELHATSTGGGAEVVPGWQLGVTPNPHALARAAADLASIASAFLLRFLVIGAIALVAAIFIVMLVARAERLASERSQFAAAAAHELRTPLAGLQLYGDMLADGLGDPGKLRDYARRMSEEASRLGRVVSNVLGFSQLERGNLSVDPEPAALDEALRELAETAEPALDRAGAALELDIPDGLRARFDRDGLARIVGNLLDNAEKYARNAEDRTIRVAAAVSTDGMIELAISDHGPGIVEHGRLFRPFERGVSNDGPAGLGLGLALSRSLARAMGGELVYRDAEGGGATFVLRLPRA
jgi:signal transduction histidine kinase